MLLSTTHQIVRFLYVRKHSSTYPNHPQKLVNVITGISNKTWNNEAAVRIIFSLIKKTLLQVMKTTSENNQNIFYIQRVVNVPSCLFWRWHCSTNSCNMCVVPRIIINNNCAVSHSSCLVTIVPPGRNLEQNSNSKKNQ